MPKREDTPRSGYEPIPETCPHGHWVGLYCGQCAIAASERLSKDIFANVVWPERDNDEPVKH